MQKVTKENQEKESKIAPAIIRERQMLVRYSISRFSMQKLRKDPNFPKALVIPALPGITGYDIKKTDQYFGLSN